MKSTCKGYYFFGKTITPIDLYSKFSKDTVVIIGKKGRELISALLLQNVVISL